MSYFIIIQGGLSGDKARSRALYPTREEAEREVFLLSLHQSASFRVGDADHYPDKGILLARHGFA